MIRQRHDAGREPHHHPDLLQRNPDRQRRLVAVGDRPQRPADPGALEEQRKSGDQDRGDRGRRDVDLLQGDEAAQHLELDGAAREVEFVGDHHLGLAAENVFAEPDQKRRQPEGRHEQDDVGLVDQRTQHDALDREGERQHDAERETERHECRHALLMQTDQRQDREHHHDALGEVEHARRLEDEHVAKRNQRVENAGDEALPQGLDQEVRRRAHLHERIDQYPVEKVHRSL
jgi:hypothetical protein